ncbi:MAG TPA: hypothetical protein VD788_01230, partial [Candidatus Polarisedimenticolaceae bacterium]|nr:hypothetical protein [Candidatus Polarisedimenticolaceae bacterium]
DYIVHRRAAGREHEPLAADAAVVPVSIESRLLAVPGDVYLSRGHSWVRPRRDRTVRVGAGRLPLHALGPPDALQLPPVGTRVHAGAALVTLSRGARRLTLRSPVDGRIESINREALARPQRVGRRPYDRGWLCTVRPTDLSRALRELLVAEEATDWLRRELGRLRDLVSGLAQPAAAAVPLRLDGGVPVEGLAGLLDEAQWGEVQSFFDRPSGD